jgi:hypothetical protein
VDLNDVVTQALQSGLDVEGAMVAAAIAKTEGGLGGAVGDRGSSFGPFQFYTGGQLPNFARAMGVSLAEAGQLARTRPDVAVQWALQPGGYLGEAIRAGQQQGLHGAKLATYAQQHGQVSVSPERAGQNFDALWGDQAGKFSATTVDLSNGTSTPDVSGTPTATSTRRVQIAPGMSADVQSFDFGAIEPSSQPLPRSSGTQLPGQGQTRRVQLAPGVGADVQSFDFSAFNLSPTTASAFDPSQWATISPSSSTRTPAVRTSQFTMDPEHTVLTSQEAAAWCGPDAAMAFAQSYGRNPTLGEAKQIASSQNLWSAGVGMHGPQSEAQLITDLGVPSSFEAWNQSPNWSHVQSTLSSGQPVILSTPKHYFYATQYDPNRDSYFVGTSGTDVTGGSEWWSPQDITNYSPIQGAIYANAP